MHDIEPVLLTLVTWQEVLASVDKRRSAYTGCSFKSRIILPAEATIPATIFSEVAGRIVIGYCHKYWIPGIECYWAIGLREQVVLSIEFICAFERSALISASLAYTCPRIW